MIPLSSPPDVGFVQELRVKKYPDFMRKKDRDTYESPKVRRGHTFDQSRYVVRVESATICMYFEV